MDHFRSHPVRVSHDGVSLPSVRFLHTLKLSKFVLVLVFYHQAREPKVCHHDTVVLRRKIVDLFITKIYTKHFNS